MPSGTNVGSAFVDLHFDGSKLAKEASRLVSAALKASALSSVISLVAGLGASAIGSIPSLAQLVSVIASTAPAAAVALPALAGLISVIATLKLATAGLGNVWKALVKGDAKAFEESLKKLSPAARDFARELQKIFPRLKAFQQSLQESFFKQFKGDLTRVTNNLLPNLSARLKDTAKIAGIQGHHLAEFLSGEYARKQIDAILESTNKGFSQLQHVPTQLAQAFLAVATSARFVLEDLGTVIASYVTQWTGKLQEAANSGAVRRFIVQGTQTLIDLGNIIANVAAGIKHVFDAAAAAGASPISTLKTLTQSFREITGSVQGSKAITDFFVGMKEAAGGAGGAAIKQIITNLLPALGVVLQTLAPVATGLINTLGPALGQILKLLAPVVATLGQGLATALSQIVPALTPLGQALLQVAEAAKPLLNVLGQELAKVIVAISPTLGPLARLISGVLQAIIPVLGAVIRALVPVIDAFIKGLQPALGPITDGFAKMATPLAQIGVALAPVAGALGKAFAELLIQLVPVLPQLLTALVPLVKALAEQFTPIILQLVPYIKPLVNILAQGLLYAIMQLTPLIQYANQGLGYTLSILKLVGGALDLVSAAVTWFVQNFGKFDAITLYINIFKASFTLVVNVVVGYIKLLVGYWQWLANLVSTVWNAITGYIKRGVAEGSRNLTAFVNAIKTGVGNAINAVKDVGQKVYNAVTGFVSKMYTGGQKLIGGFIDGIKSMVGSVVDAVGSVLSSASNLFPHSPAKEGPFSGKGWTLYAGQSTGAAFASGLLSQQDRIRNAALAVMQAANVTPAGLATATAGVGTVGAFPGAGAGGSLDRVEQLLQRILDATQDVPSGVGKEINGVGRAVRQAGRGS